MALLFCILILAYFPAKPPKPPSISASTLREDFKSGALKLARLGNRMVFLYTIYLRWGNIMMVLETSDL